MIKHAVQNFRYLVELPPSGYTLMYLTESVIIGDTDPESEEEIAADLETQVAAERTTEGLEAFLQELSDNEFPPITSLPPAVNKRLSDLRADMNHIIQGFKEVSSFLQGKPSLPQSHFPSQAHLEYPVPEYQTIGTRTPDRRETLLQRLPKFNFQKAQAEAQEMLKKQTRDENDDDVDVL